MLKCSVSPGLAGIDNERCGQAYGVVVRGPRRDQGASPEEPDRTPEELARALRDRARAAATAALREGLENIDARYGMEVANEVVGLIDIDETFAGLVDENRKSQDGDDDGPYELGLRVNL